MPRDRRRRRKKPSDPVERLGLEIYDRLEALHRELLARRGEAPAPWELELHLATCVHGPERAQSANRFAVQITQHLEEAIAQRLAATAPLMPGHLYCYWCDSASCPHSMPATARTVFTGYEPTGTPRWQDFASLCLELGDARVDELHADPPRPFSVYMSRRTLTADQLSVFGARSRTFRVLFQAAIGYIPIPSGTEIQRAAFTLQAVETQRPGQPARLGLNVAGLTPWGEPVLDHLPDARLADVFDTARRRLAELDLQRPGKARFERIVAVIKHAAQSIEKVYRQHVRRTKHARLRHRDPSRPAPSALKDARDAGREAFFLDRRRRTVIVLGPRLRTHVFNDSGQHVTSLISRPEDIERRTQTSQWVLLDDDARAEIRRRILGEGV